MYSSLDFLTALSAGLVLIILVWRSITQTNELERLKESNRILKGEFTNELTKCIMDEVDTKIAKISEQKVRRYGKPAKKGGDSQPAL